MGAMEGQMSGATPDGVHLSPATLWGILISECEGETASGQPTEAESGLQEAPTMDLVTQEELGPAHSYEAAERTLAGQMACPAILWGILLSEMSTKAMTNGSSNPESEVFDMNDIINLWIDAGYECQLPMEETAASSAVTDAELVDDEEFAQSTPSGRASGPFVIKESSGKGQGVFAARDVVKGERILVDEPFFVVTKPLNHEKVLSRFERMPLARRQQYMHLFCPNRSDDVHMTDVMCIFEANCFNIGPRSAMFLTATRFNHSCLPNTYYSWSDKRREIVLHAMIDIAEDSEMTICYGRPFCTRLERKSQLHIYSFSCNCPACQTETDFGQASESRRHTMRALEEQITMFQTMLNKALLVYGLRDPLTAILRLIETIKEEGLHGELMTPYRDAADCLKGRGNFEEALVFAHLELEEEVVCLGNDSEVVQRTIEYIEELETELERAKGEEVQEYEETEEHETDASNDLDERLTDPDIYIQESEPNQGVKAPSPEPREEEPGESVSDMQALEKPPDSETSNTCDAAVADVEKEPEEASGEELDASDPQIEDRENTLEKEVEEPYSDSGFYEDYSNEAQMDSRSSSPRLVRKK